MDSPREDVIVTKQVIRVVADESLRMVRCEHEPDCGVSAAARCQICNASICRPHCDYHWHRVERTITQDASKLAAENNELREALAAAQRHLEQIAALNQTAGKPC